MLKRISYILIISMLFINISCSKKPFKLDISKYKMVCVYNRVFSVENVSEQVILLFENGTYKELKKITNNSSMSNVRWLPDGERIVFCRNYSQRQGKYVEFFEYNIKTGKEKEIKTKYNISRLEPIDLERIFVEEDEKRIENGKNNYTTYFSIYNIKTGERKELLKFEENQLEWVRNISLSRDGKSVLLSCIAGSKDCLMRYDILKDKFEDINTEINPDSVIYMPESNRVAAIGQYEKEILWSMFMLDLETGKAERIGKVGGFITSLTDYPDENKVLFRGKIKGYKWQVLDIKTGKVEQFVPAAGIGDVIKEDSYLGDIDFYPRWDKSK